MTTLHFWRLFVIPIQRLSVRSIGNIANQLNTQQSHIYKRTYAKEELLQYLRDNTVYTSSDYVITSVPQGVKFLNKDVWGDSEKDFVCDTALQSMIPELCETFKTANCFVTKHPRRNASGMVVLSKNFEAFQFLRRHFIKAQKGLTRIYTYLVVVTGCPVQSMETTFVVKQMSKDSKFSVQIWEMHQGLGAKTEKTKYNHIVVDSTKDVSLVKISVSYDMRDCVRHILAQRCFTPVFGDSWSAKRSVNFLFGAPIFGDPGILKEGSYQLKAEILEKLQLSVDEQKYIPIHAHLYGMKLLFKQKSEFFVSVPPPESFVWTCKQLGLNEIQQFVPGLLKVKDS